MSVVPVSLRLGAAGSSQLTPNLGPKPISVKVSGNIPLNTEQSGNSFAGEHDLGKLNSVPDLQSCCSVLEMVQFEVYEL